MSKNEFPDLEGCRPRSAGRREIFMLQDQTSEILGSMPVKKAVMKQILPAVASQMVTLIYNLADTFFVGKLNIPAETAAITVSFSSFLMLSAISNLIGVGGASAIARALGRREGKAASQIAGISFWCGVFSGILYSLLYLSFEKPLLVLCGATDHTLEIAMAYTRWVIVIGGPFTILNALLANLVRAEGDAMHAFIGISAGGVLNMILDPFFILPRWFGLGAAGAGMATAISAAAAVAYFVGYLILRRRTTVLSLSPRHLRHFRRHIGNILSIGFPSAMQAALTVVAVSVQSRFVSKYAVTAVAALGIIKKLDQLPIYFAMGVASGLLPFLAYNHASGNHERHREAFRFGCTVSCSFAVFCLIVYEIFAPQLAGLFIQDPETIHYASGFLRRMVTAMPMMAICYPMITEFQATGEVKAALVCSMLRKGVLDIPLSIIFDKVYPLYGLMWVPPVIDTVSMLTAVLFERHHAPKSEHLKPHWKKGHRPVR